MMPVTVPVFHMMLAIVPVTALAIVHASVIVRVIVRVTVLVFLEALDNCQNPLPLSSILVTYT